MIDGLVDGELPEITIDYNIHGWYTYVDRHLPIGRLYCFCIALVLPCTNLRR